MPHKEREQNQRTNHTFRHGRFPTKTAVPMDAVVAGSGSRTCTSGSSVIFGGFESLLRATDSLARPVLILTRVPITTIVHIVTSGLSTLAPFKLALLTMLAVVLPFAGTGKMSLGFGLAMRRVTTTKVGVGRLARVLELVAAHLAANTRGASSGINFKCKKKSESELASGNVGECNGAYIVLALE